MVSRLTYIEYYNYNLAKLLRICNYWFSCLLNHIKSVIFFTEQFSLSLVQKLMLLPKYIKHLYYFYFITTTNLNIWLAIYSSRFNHVPNCNVNKVIYIIVYYLWVNFVFLFVRDRKLYNRFYVMCASGYYVLIKKKEYIR